jgi:hypothetical protein
VTELANQGATAAKKMLCRERRFGVGGFDGIQGFIPLHQISSTLIAQPKTGIPI